MLRVSFNLEEHNAFIRLIRFGDASRPMRTQTYDVLIRNLQKVEPHYILFLNTNHKLDYFDF